MSSPLSLPDAGRTEQAGAATLPDQEALGRLLDVQRECAFNLSFRLLGRREEAADAVQDAYFKALRAARSGAAPVHDPDYFRAWFLKVVSNVALDHLRQRGRRPAGPLGDLERTASPDERGQPARELDRREQRSAILRALLTLPATQRAALTLREYQGLTYDEIGEQLGLNRAATTTLLFRARASFREAYEGVAARDEPVGCPRLAPLLSALLDGELDRRSWSDVDRHLHSCARCKRELRNLRRARRLHAAIPLLAPPSGWCWAALTGAGTAEAVGALAITAASAPAVAPAIGAGVVGASAASGFGGMMAGLGSLVGGKAAAVVVAAGVTVAVATSAPAAGPSTAAEASAGPPVSIEARRAAELPDAMPPESPRPDAAAPILTRDRPDVAGLPSREPVAPESAPSDKEGAKAASNGRSVHAPPLVAADAEERTERRRAESPGPADVGADPPGAASEKPSGGHDDSDTPRNDAGDASDPTSKEKADAHDGLPGRSEATSNGPVPGGPPAHANAAPGARAAPRFAAGSTPERAVPGEHRREANGSPGHAGAAIEPPAEQGSTHAGPPEERGSSERGGGPSSVGAAHGTPHQEEPSGPPPAPVTATRPAAPPAPPPEKPSAAPPPASKPSAVGAGSAPPPAVGPPAEKKRTSDPPKQEAQTKPPEAQKQREPKTAPAPAKEKPSPPSKPPESRKPSAGSGATKPSKKP